MQWTCNFSVSMARIDVVFQNDTNMAMIYVLHRPVVGAKKDILEHLDAKSSDLKAMGKIWFFNEWLTWEEIRPRIESMLENF